MSKKLIQVHAKTPRRVWCSHCDTGEGVDTDIWYEVKDPTPYSVEMFARYLPCCLQKVGVVVDWQEQEEKDEKYW
jgi:hypothetical protein